MRYLPLLAVSFLTSTTVNASDESLIARLAPKISPIVISEAVSAMKCAQNHGVGKNASRIAIIDYTIPSKQPRLWVVDLKAQKLLFEEYVAHGQGSGDDIPRFFSDRDGSHQTSLGLFLTDATYQGGNGLFPAIAWLEQRLQRIRHASPDRDARRALREPLGGTRHGPSGPFLGLSGGTHGSGQADDRHPEAGSVHLRTRPRHSKIIDL